MAPTLTTTTPHQQPAITIKAIPLNTPPPDLYSSYELDVHGKKHIITFIPTGSTKPALLAKPVWEQMGKVYLIAVDKLRTATSQQDPDQQIKSITIDTTTGISYTYLDPAKATQLHLPNGFNLQLAPEIRSAFNAANEIISQALMPNQRLWLSNNGTNAKDYKSSNNGCLKPDESSPLTPGSSAVHSTQPPAPGPTAPLPAGAPVGLSQRNNNCWANSILQMICASDNLKNYVLDEGNPVLRPNSLLAPIANLVVEYDAAQRNSSPHSIDTNVMRIVLFNLTKNLKYQGTTQVDASEALHDIIQRLHTAPSAQEITNALDRPPTKTQEKPFLRVPCSSNSMRNSLLALHNSPTTSTIFTHPPKFLPIEFTRVLGALSKPLPQIEELFELPNEMVKNSTVNDSHLYQLVSVIKHEGDDPTSGHWTSLVINREDPRATKYFLCNDHVVQPIDLNRAHAFMQEGTTFLYEPIDETTSPVPQSRKSTHLPHTPSPRRHSISSIEGRPRSSSMASAIPSSLHPHLHSTSSSTASSLSSSSSCSSSSPTLPTGAHPNEPHTPAFVEEIPDSRSSSTTTTSTSSSRASSSRRTSLPSPSPFMPTQPSFFLPPDSPLSTTSSSSSSSSSSNPSLLDPARLQTPTNPFASSTNPFDDYDVHTSGSSSSSLFSSSSAAPASSAHHSFSFPSPSATPASSNLSPSIPTTTHSTNPFDPNYHPIQDPSAISSSISSFSSLPPPSTPPTFSSRSPLSPSSYFQEDNSDTDNDADYFEFPEEDPPLQPPSSSPSSLPSASSSALIANPPRHRVGKRKVSTPTTTNNQPDPSPSPSSRSTPPTSSTLASSGTPYTTAHPPRRMPGPTRLSPTAAQTRENHQKLSASQKRKRRSQGHSYRPHATTTPEPTAPTPPPSFLWRLLHQGKKS